VVENTTAVGEEKRSLTPATFALYQNYPNPFNPLTNIGFRIAESGMVTLKVYDVLGREVSTIVEEYKSAGEYKIELNASLLPSGIYFYRLSVSAWTGRNGQERNFSETKKLVLMK
jgi:Secretion system C-terminal sorting domain